MRTCWAELSLGKAGRGSRAGAWGWVPGGRSRWGWEARAVLWVGDKEKRCVLISESLRGLQNLMPWPHLLCFNS